MKKKIAFIRLNINFTGRATDGAAELASISNDKEGYLHE